MSPKEEHLKKIREAEQLLHQPNLSRKRKRDLIKWHHRLKKELAIYESYIK